MAILHTETFGPREWQTLKVEFTELEIQHAMQQAKLKSQFTMNASQSGATRTSNEKYQRQLMGILAEIACESYLNNLLNPGNSKKWRIERYDNIRTDGFQSPENEFDIRITNVENPAITYTVESRSSVTHNKSFEYGIANYDVIGSYASVAKQNEEANDFYLRPLYRYLDFEKGDYYRLNFDNMLDQGRIELYLVSGCALETMQQKGVNKTMAQGGTVYRAVKHVDAGDMNNFSKELKDKLESTKDN